MARPSGRRRARHVGEHALDGAAKRRPHVSLDERAWSEPALLDHDEVVFLPGEPSLERERVRIICSTAVPMAVHVQCRGSAAALDPAVVVLGHHRAPASEVDGTGPGPPPQLEPIMIIEATRPHASKRSVDVGESDLDIAVSIAVQRQSMDLDGSVAGNHPDRERAAIGTQPTPAAGGIDRPQTARLGPPHRPGVATACRAQAKTHTDEIDVPVIDDPEAADGSLTEHPLPDLLPDRPTPVEAAPRQPMAQLELATNRLAAVWSRVGHHLGHRAVDHGRRGRAGSWLCPAVDRSPGTHAEEAHDHQQGASPVHGSPILRAGR
jgi:hypothetical protein